MLKIVLFLTLILSLRQVNVVLFFFFSGVQSNNHINKVVSHPTLPVTITAHEDRHIKFFDNKTGKDKENQTCMYEYV